MASVSSSSYQGRYFKFTVTQSGTSTTVNWTFEVLGGEDNYYTASPITCKIGSKTVYSTDGITDWSTEKFPAAKGSKSGTYDTGSYNSVTISLLGRPYYHDAGDAETATLSLTKPTYTITYNANGGSLGSVPSSQTKTHGTDVKVTSAEPTRTGYTFKGWSVPDRDDVDEKYHTDVYYTPNETIQYNGSQTLKAVWEENYITVNLYSNYATYGTYEGKKLDVSGSTNVVVHTKDYLYDNSYGDGLSNVQNEEYLYLSRTGYVATGKWGTSPSGGILLDQTTSYTGKALAEAVGKSLASGNATINLYAQWSENKLTVNYYSNYATYGTYTNEALTVSASTNVLVHSQDFYYDNAVNSGLADIQNEDYLYLHRMGYTSTGYWGTSANGGTLVNEKTSFDSGQALAEEFGKTLVNGDASINIYPQWQINTYTINYNSNGGSGNMDSQTVEWNETFQFAKNEFSREGRELVGWNLNRSDDDTWYVIGQGWLTEEEILTNGYEKKLYEEQEELTLDASWVRDNEEAREYTLYAVWKMTGAIYIDDGVKFIPYFAYIDNGSSWDLCMAYIDDGVKWNIIS